MEHFIRLLPGALMAGLLTACTVSPTAGLTGATGYEGASRSQTLRIGVDRESAPMSFDDGGVIRGIEADFGRMLADELGLKPVFVPMSFDVLRSELGAGQIDIIMAGMSVTESRKQMVSFAEPYMHIGQCLIVKRERLEEMTPRSAVDRTNIRIAVETGTTGAAYANSAFTQARVYALPSLDDCLSFLRAGKVDAVMYDSAVMVWRAKQQPDELAVVPGEFTQEPLAWAVRRGNQKLLANVNEVLARWQADGTVDEVLNRWLGEQEAD